jgi:hypothetical protein
MMMGLDQPNSHLSNLGPFWWEHHFKIFENKLPMSLKHNLTLAFEFEEKDATSNEHV